MNKPFAPPCERNKNFILEKLRPILANEKNVLEIGSGTGQHAVHFAKHMPHLIWQPSDLEVALSGIQAWADEANLSNLKPPAQQALQRIWRLVETISFSLLKRPSTI